MPIAFSEKISPVAALAIWKIKETESELLEQINLSLQDKTAILSLRLEKRRLERIACRRALAFLLNTNTINITYGKSGEPFSPPHHISFSHSGHFAAAAISTSGRIGVDIEKITPKILKLHHKFISEKENTRFNLSDPTEITFIWCAKEAIYKLFPGNSIDFIEDIEILSSSAATLYISNDRFDIILKRYVFDDYMTVIASN